jgi:pseudouridine synthase
MNNLGVQTDANLKDSNSEPQLFEYIKYWKPIGITCTTDRRIQDNLIDALKYDGCNPECRIFPVGRLDKDTSGIILMTSDGRLPNASLRGYHKHPKTYMVKANRPVSEADIQTLRSGVVITTVAQRDGNRAKPLTAPTLPCQVRAIQSQYAQSKNLESRILEITLVEGRNRQIRRMMEAVGYRVLGLHRKAFMGITLDNLEGEGDWSFLDEDEMKIVDRVLQQAELDKVEYCAENDT